MSTPETEPSVGQLAKSVSELTAGMKWFLALFLVVVSVPNFFATLAIPRFQQIFQDALPGKPLPLITLMFVGYHTLFLLLTLAWPIAGVVIIARGQRVRNWAIAGALLIFAVGIQLALTEFAMFTPMVGIEVGMSDQGGH